MADKNQKGIRFFKWAQEGHFLFLTQSTNLFISLFFLLHFNSAELMAMETAEQFVKHWLPQETQNREKLIQYLNQNDVEWAPTIRGNWDRGEKLQVVWKPYGEKNLLEFNDVLEEQKGESLGLFKVNHQSINLWDHRYSGDLMEHLRKIEGILRASSDEVHYHQGSFSNSNLRERNAVFLLTLMYSRLFSQSPRLCYSTESILNDWLINEPYQVLKISLCQKDEIKLLIKSKYDPTQYLLLHWVNDSQERIVVQEWEVKSNSPKSVSWEYYYSRGSLSEVRYRDLKKKQTNIFGIHSRDKLLISVPMLINSSHFYQMIERFHNTGKKWGLSCLDVCSEELAAAFTFPVREIANDSPVVRVRRDK